MKTPVLAVLAAALLPLATASAQPRPDAVRYMQAHGLRPVDGVEAAQASVRAKDILKRSPNATGSAGATAAPALRSMANDFADNPFVALGVNPETRIVTGYVAALRTAPGRTDACRFLFRGSLSRDGPVRLAIRDAMPGSRQASAAGGTKAAAAGNRASALLGTAQGKVRITLPDSLAPGDCDWILGSGDNERIAVRDGGFVISADAGEGADWTGVVAIGSARAYFHDAPDARAVRKAYLVRGDVAYVTQERPGWYQVRFTHAMKPTAGWIKASDTMPF